MIQTLVSVPSPLDAWWRTSSAARALAPLSRAADFVASDPAGSKLGSGGGTVSLLYAAWRELGRSATFADWIRSRQCLVLHAGGESRRLPAYAGVGKALLPVPRITLSPNRFDQILADFQVPAYREILTEAGPHCAVLVASGDVWLELDPFALPRVQSDIAGIGMRVPPEIAQHFGVYFVSKAAGIAQRAEASEQPIAFFRQKPSTAEIYRHASKYDFLVDTGLWLFSARAIELLFRRCGWNQRQQRFRTPTKSPAPLDLYTEIGTALGTMTTPPALLDRLGWSALSTSVIPLEDARFLHVGSSRQLLESYERLVATQHDRPKLYSFATVQRETATASNLPVWIDGVPTCARWEFDGHNIVTGAAHRLPPLRLAQGQCVEIAPVANNRFVCRPYSIDDTLRGTVGRGALICGQDARTWLQRRGFVAGAEDIFAVRVYPVLRSTATVPEVIEWFFSASPAPEITTGLAVCERLSAAEIPGRIDFNQYFRLRAAGHDASIIAQFDACRTTGDSRVFEQDFAAIAVHSRQRPHLRRWLLRHGPGIARQISRSTHASRLLMLLSELNRGNRRQQYALAAHRRLQGGLVASEQFEPPRPHLALKEDQIVWGRSPVRLDLAGGWTDTPPYCLEHGGAVLNVAVLLNGQPPIQVFIRPLAEPVISLRSIDLGSSEVISTYGALAGFRDPRSGFSLPKAALAMAGFHPDFTTGRTLPTLKARLGRFGGGLEISLLSAVPKGSGLGTSSILAATILGALNRACGLGWDSLSLYKRVLGVEQLLTTGGGWQDQAGALFRGIKLIETVAGPSQAPSVRYLPQHLFGPDDTNRSTLLYYTGITRLAKGILREIVEEMFAGRFATLQTLGLIRANAHALFGAIQQGDRGAFLRCIARSWNLNKRLDAGTSSPPIESIRRCCGTDLVAAKLLGAGGGGYMLICAPDGEAGQRIRAKLEKDPPNARARFIDFEIANSGLEVTVS